MLSHSIYSVISPEGCASILWKTAEKAAQASEALGLTADKLQSLGIVEYVVDEGEGAHLDPERVMQNLKVVLKQALDELLPMDANERMRSTLSTFNEVWQRKFRRGVLKQAQEFSEKVLFLLDVGGGMIQCVLLHLMAQIFLKRSEQFILIINCKIKVQSGGSGCHTGNNIKYSLYYSKSSDCNGNLKLKHVKHVIKHISNIYKKMKFVACSSSSTRSGRNSYFAIIVRCVE